MINCFIATMTIWTPNLELYSGPRYKALTDAIAAAIKNQELSAGEKLPPQRRLADALGVTLGTVTRAYALAEQRGIVHARVGSGTYVGSPVVETALPALQEKQINLAACVAPLGPQLEYLSAAMQTLSQQPQALAQLTRYQTPFALPQRDAFSDWLSARGIVHSSENLLLTQGGQQAISIALQAICRPGDTVLCDALCYTGFRIAAKALGLKVVSLANDDEGLKPEALENACKQYNPKAIYLMPNNQNPLCLAMPEVRRERVVEICSDNGVFIIEDDVNYVLPEESVAPLFARAPDCVCYLGSLSKNLAGGMRIGYLIMPEALVLKAQQALHASCWMVSGLGFELCKLMFADGSIDKVHNWLADNVRRRQALAREILGETGKVFRMRGFNIWLGLEEGMSSRQIAMELACKEVQVRAMTDFGPVSAEMEGLRLSISAVADINQLSLGLNLVKQVIEQNRFQLSAMV